MISATADCTDAGVGTSSRIRSATAPGSAVSENRSHRIEALQQAVDRGRLELVGDRVGDQPSGAVGDLLTNDESVLPERRAGCGQVDDPLDEAGQGRELD